MLSGHLILGFMNFCQNVKTRIRNNEDSQESLYYYLLKRSKIFRLKSFGRKNWMRDYLPIENHRNKESNEKTKKKIAKIKLPHYPVMS